MTASSSFNALFSRAHYPWTQPCSAPASIVSNKLIAIDLRSCPAISSSFLANVVDVLGSHGIFVLSRNGVSLVGNVSKLLKPLLLIGTSPSNDTCVVGVKSHANSWLVEKHLVDLLKSTSGRLHTKEVRQWDERGTDDSPDPEVIATNVVHTDRSDHDNNEI